MNTSNPQWDALLRRYQDRLTCPNPLNAYFEQSGLNGHTLAQFVMGRISFPTGAVVVADPFTALSAESAPYYAAVPTGTYDVEVAVLCDPDEEAHDAAVRVRFGNGPAVTHLEALTGSEDLNSLQTEEGESYFGFPVDAGMACICDAAARNAYLHFVRQWEQTHPEGDLYRDFFVPLLEQERTNAPKHRHGCGDYLDLVIPGSQLHMPIFPSGYGDGVYPVYFGYNARGQICELVVQFIDIEPESDLEEWTDPNEEEEEELDWDSMTAAWLADR